MSKVNIVFSPTSLDIFLTCKAKYNYAQNMRKTLPTHQKAASLDFGSLGHTGLETYYKLLASGAHYNDRMQAALLSIKTKAADVTQSNIDEEGLATILRTVEVNLDYWRSEDEQLEILGVEEPFDFILHEDDFIRIIISGKIDLRVNVHGIGGNSSYNNLPFDHKFFQRDSLVTRTNNQFIAYTIPTESNFLIVNRVGLQKTLKPEEKFKRPPLSFDPDFLQSWKDDTIATITNEYLSCVKEGKWPVNFTSCTKYNRLCEFHQVCNSSGQESKNWLLETQYVDREKWDKYEKGIE